MMNIERYTERSRGFIQSAQSLARAPRAASLTVRWVESTS